MDTHSFFLHILIGNSADLILYRELQDETDTDLGLLELTVSRKGRHWILTEINTCINTYRMSALKVNNRGEGRMGPAEKASLKR